MWDDRFAEVCRRHPDLVAVYESGRGRLGLLLRQTLVPLDAERMEWLAETRGVSRPLITALREAGFTGGAVVLQWLPIHDVARIVTRWIRRWDGDSTRRSQLLGVVERRLSDERFVAARSRQARGAPGAATAPEPAESAIAALEPPPSPTIGAALDQTGLDALKAWYAAMAPCWLAIQPARRRRLVLQTHVWLADLALGDPLGGPPRALADLGPDGSLARALRRLASGPDMAGWRRWIDVVREELARALERPPAQRTQLWARSLFFIPYRASAPPSRAAGPRRSFDRAPVSRATWTAEAARAKMEA
jgi:hypothetical protein